MNHKAYLVLRSGLPALWFVLWFSIASSIATANELAIDEGIDFRNDVMPVLTKHGCNAGSCHGSAVGRGGFKLSLYGGRPDSDFVAITRESKGRRINRFDPEKSLFLRKPIGDIGHGGEQRFEPSSADARILMAWIKQGARSGIPNQQNPVTLVELDLGEQVVRYDSVDVQHPFKFLARFSDGTRRDVTAWTVLTSNDASSASVDADSNIATVHRPGRHVLIARYLNIVKSVEIVVPFDNQVAPIQWKRDQNQIDDAIYQKLNQLGLPATGTVDDTGFFRRLSVDLTGRLPTPEEIGEFESDSALDKRSQWIARLMRSKSFDDYWTFRFSNLLRIRSQPQDSQGARTYHSWLRKQIAGHQPWDDIARKLLLARGDSHVLGPPNFFRTTPDARSQAEFVSEALMGVTLRCANCHNHPLDSWTQDDYHGLAAIFAKTKQNRFVVADPNGENIHPVTGFAAIPRVPAQSAALNSNTNLGTIDMREPFADWLLDDQNPYFARAMVNRIWQALMGRGLVGSLDDLRATSPASHPQLLQWLADDFVAHDFDVRHTISQICHSQAYQRDRRRRTEAKFNNALLDHVYYGYSPPRPLPPEVLSDAICDVTRIPESFSKHTAGTRAVELFDSRIPSRALDVLGRCSREESCESTGRSPGGQLSTQLHLINGDLINQKIGSTKGRLKTLIDLGISTEAIVSQFYLRSYSRRPSSNETNFWNNAIDQGGPGTELRRKRLEDFVWSLLNSQEFLTNH